MTDSAIRYIRLTNGDEVLGCLTEAGEGAPLGSITVTDPLVVESYVNEDNPMQRMVYMTRYAPFAAENSVTFAGSVVVTCGPVNPIVARYYEVSREYCRTKTDSQFMNGIRETIEHVDSILSPPRALDESSVTKVHDAITMMALASFTSNTVN